MIAGLAAWLITKRIATSAPGARIMAKGIAVALAAIAVALAVVLAIAIHDKGVIERHEMDKRADQADAALKGERRANAAADDRQAKFEDEQAQLKGKSDEEISKDPDGGRRAVGPGQRGYFDGLPQQGN